MDIRVLSRLAAVVLAAILLALPRPGGAEPADIAAAARGVVRIVIMDRQGETLAPVSHGSGFAVGPEHIVTNAHVVSEAMNDDMLAIGIVPSDGEDAVYARIVAVSPRSDLALLTTTAPMRLPPLTLSGNPQTDSGPVTAVGYPVNVDRAQGLTMDDIFRAQPPVTSAGFLSGRRPTREFDSLLHTAPIARGNSGGPLLDECGRVLGVNSFGAESGSADAEFFFAVSNRELIPFLRGNDITPRINALPCRSMAELEAAEQDRLDRAQSEARDRASADANATARRREEMRREMEFEILAERDNALALAGLLVILALGASGFAYLAHDRGDRRPARIAGGVAVVAVLVAVVCWLSRPGYGEIADRVQQELAAERHADEAQAAGGPATGKLVCVLDTSRSRVTTAAVDDVPLEWNPDGCVNTRTQYAPAQGEWSRILVPAEEAAVSVNRFDPVSREYRMDRYLLGSEAMRAVREARGQYEAPSCGAAAETIRQFAAQQSAVQALLPPRPNERLVYNCRPQP